MIVYVLLPLCILILVIIVKHHSKESFYGRPGIPSTDLEIPIKWNLPHGQTFIDYSTINFEHLCPNNGKETHCKTYLDCGPAELCVDSEGWISRYVDDESSSYKNCKCSIQNPCLIAGNIC